MFAMFLWREISNLVTGHTFLPGQQPRKSRMHFGFAGLGRGHDFRIAAEARLQLYGRFIFFGKGYTSKIQQRKTAIECTRMPRLAKLKLAVASVSIARVKGWSKFDRPCGMLYHSILQKFLELSKLIIKPVIHIM